MAALFARRIRSDLLCDPRYLPNTDFAIYQSVSAIFSEDFMTQLQNSALFDSLVIRLREGETVETLVDELISELVEDELLDLLDGDAEVGRVWRR